MRGRIEYEWRLWFLIVTLLLIVLGLLGRIIYLGVIKHNFLLDQSNMRSVRDVSTSAHRGIISDRNGEPLAISIPVGSIWVNPKLFVYTKEELDHFAKLLVMDAKIIKAKVAKQSSREFVYIKRSLAMETAERILSLHIPGVFLEKGYRRHYPEGEAAAHVIGFTNIDDVGQEGIELAYDNWLRGIPGKTRVVKDRLGNTVATLGVISEPKEGRNLTLSIDRRIQYLAHNELKNAMVRHRAESGSVVVLSAKTGEILAMVNMPSYDPNNRREASPSRMRNRAVTDLFEPGSTTKIFTIASALSSGKYQSESLVDTNPGVFVVDGHRIHDNAHKNNGILTVKSVLQKSSDIGVAKITLSLPSDNLLRMLRLVGFGKSTQSGFPGEAQGFVPSNLKKRQFVLATLSFGYSISVTALQLAQAYAVIAAHGMASPITFLKAAVPPEKKEILPKKLCLQLLNMLEAVINTGGTGTRARVSGYRVAGKTGTAHIASPAGGYYTDRYFSNFVGLAPVSDPELVVVAVIKNPRGLYHGGLVAAPIFANVMNGALRILGIKLDNVDSI